MLSTQPIKIATYIRFTLLLLCSIFSLISIYHIIQKKLYKCRPISYILYSQISTLIMIQLAFGYLIYTNFFGQPNSTLCQIQGYLFRVSQIISLCFTSFLLYLIHKGISNKSFNLTKINHIIMFSIIFCFLIMLPPVINKSYQPCHNLSISYNCLCFKTQNPYRVLSLITYILPNLFICIYMVIKMYQINKSILQKNQNFSDEKKISLCLTKFPVWNVSFIIINISISIISEIFKQQKKLQYTYEIILFTINLTIFLLPIPNLIAIYNYYQMMLEFKAIKSRLISFTSNSSDDIYT